MQNLANTDELQWLHAMLRGDNPDWPADNTDLPEKILQAAEQNGVLTLIAYSLSSNNISPNCVPLNTEFKLQLKQHLAEQSYADLVMHKEAQDVFEALQETKTPALVLKGAALSQQVYPETYLRTRSDLDILIPDRKHFDALWPQLAEYGYKRATATSNSVIDYQTLCYKQHNEKIINSLDIHWKISNVLQYANELDFTILHESSVKLGNLHEYARGLSLPHAYIFGCMHRAGHIQENQHNRLIWLHDLFLISHKLSQPDTQLIQGLVINNPLATTVLSAIDVLSGIYTDKLPEEIINMANNIRKSTTVSFPLPRRRLDIMLSNFQQLSGWGKICFILEHLFPAKQYMYTRYRTQQPILLPLLYILRLIQSAPKFFMTQNPGK